MTGINLQDPNIAYMDGKDVLGDIKHIVYWVLGNFCPYKCSYCIPEFNSGKHDYPNIGVIQEVFKKLPECLVNFGGGEPTYHPEFERIISEKPDHIRVGVLSNAARSFSFWERIVEKLDNTYLAYHIEYGNLSRFLDTAILVYKTHKRHGHVVVPMLPRKWDECVAVYNTMIKENLPVMIKPIMTDWKYISKEYTAEQLAWVASKAQKRKKFIQIIDKNGEIMYNVAPEEVVSNKMNNFFNWTCYVPLHYTHISSAGNVRNTGCTAGVNSGNIYTDFEINTDYIVCKREVCSVYSDIEGIRSVPAYSGYIPGIIK
jgi:organic radical activating enzyme